MNLAFVEGLIGVDGVTVLWTLAKIVGITGWPISRSPSAR